MILDETSQQIADVIEHFNDLEMRIAMTLRKCLLPVTSDYGFLQELLFHNTILSFSAKVQLLERILDYWSWRDLKSHIGRFKELMKLRNAFAHTPTVKRELLVYFPPDEEFAVPLGSHMVVEKKTSTSWDNIPRDKAFKIYTELHQKCAELLIEIDGKITETVAQQPAPGDKK